MKQALYEKLATSDNDNLYERLIPFPHTNNLNQFIKFINQTMPT